MAERLYIENLEKFESLVKNENIINGNPAYSPLVFVDGENKHFEFDESKVFYKKVPQVGGARMLFAMKLLQAINNNYIPIFDTDNNLLYTQEEFQQQRQKMGGIKEYGAGDFVLSSNLEFEGLEQFLERIDSNIEEVNKKRGPVVEEFVRLMQSIGLTTTIGNNSGGDIELVEAGSTMRGTNLPQAPGKTWDFDYTVRMDSNKVWDVKEVLESQLPADDHITKTSTYKVRLVGVDIPNMEEKIDLDFSLTPQKEYYLATEDAISEQLDNIKGQSEEKYRLVLANIMFAKAFMKKIGVYKPSRGILEGDRQLGGLGGVGIENWVLQNGGSFIDAAMSFVKAAEGKEFIEFEQEFAIMDFGKNHVEVSKHNFPYDNFVMKNMRHIGFDKMKEGLKKFLIAMGKMELPEMVEESNQNIHI